ncbi:hypothetical protein IPM19_03490 [bacterium]|nr:MAG: hypothetical protein IPM19_03490 [bacterium]
MKGKNGNGKRNGAAERKQCSGCFILMAEQETGMQKKYGKYFHAGPVCIKKYDQYEQNRKDKEASRPTAVNAAQPLASPA